MSTLHCCISAWIWQTTNSYLIVDWVVGVQIRCRQLIKSRPLTAAWRGAARLWNHISIIINANSSLASSVTGLKGTWLGLGRELWSGAGLRLAILRQWLTTFWLVAGQLASMPKCQLADMSTLQQVNLITQRVNWLTSELADWSSRRLVNWLKVKSACQQPSSDHIYTTLES